LLSELTYGSLLVYSPRGQTEVSRRSASLVRVHLKNDRALEDGTTTSQYLASTLRSRPGIGPLREFFAENATLVPVPTSTLQKPHSLWVPLNLATAMVDQGFGRECQPCLKRARPVPKAAFASSGERPTARDHLESLEVELTLGAAPQSLMLIDDVVTKGSTLLGCAWRLERAFPGVEIKAFAAVRTKELQPEIDAIWEPWVSSIRSVFGDAVRDP